MRWPNLRRSAGSRVPHGVDSTPKSYSVLAVITLFILPSPLKSSHSVNDPAMIRLSHTTGSAGQRLVDRAWRLQPSRPVLNSQALNGLAGPSRLPFTPTYRAAAYSTPSALRKGKQLEAGSRLGQALITPITRDASTLPVIIRRWANPPMSSRLGQVRLFHATARRQALPLIPVALGIFKVGRLRVPFIKRYH